MSAPMDRKLRSSWEGALAGGGDPASSPLYVFGPFFALLTTAGVAAVAYGAAIWLAVATIIVVSLLYRLVMQWIVDGSGGTGLSEEELGPWAAKLSAAITCIEYTLTILVSIAALVTFVADRVDLGGAWLGVDPRTWLAVAVVVTCGALVNRGPRVVSFVFGPATAGVLVLLWVMMIATVARRGFHLAPLRFEAFRGDTIRLTLGGFVRILALMTGIEVFANLVASYSGSAVVRSRKAFRSLMIIMGSTALTMVIVAPAVFDLSDPTDEKVSVFTQTMDALLPRPLALAGTGVGILVLLSAAAASALGIQSLFHGLSVRHYAPAAFRHHNSVGVATRPVWAQVVVVVGCFVVLGTREATYLAVYAAGVFVLLSMTSWAAVLRLVRHRRVRGTVSTRNLVAVVAAALFTTTATIVLFVERFTDGVWIYFVLVPLVAGTFDVIRRVRGDPGAPAERMGRLLARWQGDEVPALMTESLESDVPVEHVVERLRNGGATIEAPAGGRVATVLHLAPRRAGGGRWRMTVPLDGSAHAERALRYAIQFERIVPVELMLLHVAESEVIAPAEAYLEAMAAAVRPHVRSVSIHVEQGEPASAIVAHAELHEVVLVVMSAHGHTGIRRVILGSVTREVISVRSVAVLAVV